MNSGVRIFNGHQLAGELGGEERDEQAATRRVGELILEQDPTLSPAAFAGRMAKETNTPPQKATDMYIEITDGDSDTGGSGETTVQKPVEPESKDATPRVEGVKTTTRNDDIEPAGGDDATGEGVTIGEHYERVAHIYENLGTTDRSLFAIGNDDFTGWYYDRPGGGSEWVGEGRPRAMGKETGDLLENVERVVYATTNYTPGRFFMDAWDYYEWDEPEDPDDKPDREWRKGDSPTPGYDEFACIAPFADIDLEDHVKYDRPEGDIPRGEVEDALGRYIDAFAELGGGHEHVFALDSVGGAYVMVAPRSTMPIAREFDGEEQSMVFQELMSRLNNWLTDTAESINSEVPAVEGVFEPDQLNNKNRLYKAPMSVHSSLDGVVTPIDATAEGSPDYEFTPIEAVDESLVAATDRWATGFTGDHEDAVSDIVSALWSDEFEQADGWAEALTAWLEAEQEPDGDDTGVGGSGSLNLRAEDIPDDLESTDDMDVVFAAVEGIDVREVARKTSDEWETAGGRDPPRFAASWHTSHSSGTSCFANRDKFVDLDNGGEGGGALQLVALAEGLVSRVGDTPEGDDFWEAVNILRGMGFSIPYYEGPDGKHDDVLRVYEPADDKREKKNQLVRALFN